MKLEEHFAVRERQGSSFEDATRRKEHTELHAGHHRSYKMGRVLFRVGGFFHVVLGGL